MKYQPHLDGLRTVAVVPVIVFHLGSPLFPGGFVGVDIFFVISGFLITGILLEDMSKGRYSLLEFYKRRILRILPALSVVLITTFLLSGLLFFDMDRQETGRTILAAAAFISNIYFWQSSDYFSAPAEANPLLHTWSLAVEEQFYIFFPPLLYAMARYARRHLFLILVLLCAVSLIGCIALTMRYAPHAFYLLPSRAWELGAGAALAIWTRDRNVPWAGNALPGLVGIAFVLLSMAFINSDSLFPGWIAIWPVAGATLLIGWGDRGLLGRLLSSAPFVFIGKISYSLYLWHWPVIVFWKAQMADDLTAATMIMLGAVSVLLALASTRFIEKPFRSPEMRDRPASRVVWAGAASLAVLALTGVAALSNYNTFRSWPENVAQIAAVANYRETPEYVPQFRKGTCFIGSEDGSFAAFDKANCAQPVPGGINVLIMGDSHAAQYAGPLIEAFPEVNVLQATASGCRPLRGSSGEKGCTDLRRWAFEELLPGGRIDLVILGGRWLAKEKIHVARTLKELEELAPNTVVFGPTVEYEGVFPELLARSEMRGTPFDFEKLRTPGRDRMNVLMRAEVENAGATYIDVLTTECDMDACRLMAPDGQPMIFDYGHLTFSGARYVIEENRPTLASLLPIENTLFEE